MAATDLSLEEQFSKILKEYKQTLDKTIEDALTDVANTLIQDLSLNSPVGKTSYDVSSDSKHFRDCWAMKTKYHGVRYVGNTKKVHDGIPLSNLIEFGSKGHPFIQKTFNASKNKLYTQFVNKLKK